MSQEFKNRAADSVKFDQCDVPGTPIISFSFFGKMLFIYFLTDLNAGLEYSKFGAIRYDNNDDNQRLN